MKNPVSKTYGHTGSSHGRKNAKSNLARFGSSVVVLASAVIAAQVAGCARLPDKTIIASSLSSELGYPNTSTEKMTTASARKSNRMLPVKQVSRGYLGRAQYICTPSGFGRTSGCFLRKS
jgi:hypothetical protein